MRRLGIAAVLFAVLLPCAALAWGPMIRSGGGRTVRSGGGTGPLAISAAPAGSVLQGTRGQIVTVSRASTRTCQIDGTLETVAANAGCVGDFGLVVEPQRTQAVSGPSDASSWTVTGTASVDGPISGPDGDADGWTANIGTSGNDLRKLVSGLGNGAAVAVSFWYKRPAAFLGSTIVANPYGVGSGYWLISNSALTDEWTRITPTHYAVTVSNAFVANASGQAGVQFYVSSGSMSFGITRLQMEAGAFHTSFIAAAGLRPQDAVSVSTGTGLEPLRITGRFTAPWGLAQLGLWAMGTSGANRIYAGMGASGNLAIYASDSTGTLKWFYSAIDAGDRVPWSEHEVKLTYDPAGTASIEWDGEAKAISTGGTGSGIIASLGSVLTIGGDGSYFLGGSVRDLKVCRERDFARCSSPVPAPSAVAALGDSITYSAVATPYPTRLGQHLGSGFATTNMGLSGDRTDQMLARWQARSVDYSRLVLLGGVNDLIQDRTAEQIIADIQSIIADATSSGAQASILTVLPFKNSTYWSEARQTQLEALNVSIRALQGVAIIDAHDAFGDGDPDALLAAYDSGDGLHPNQYGADALARLVAAAIEATP